MAIVDCSCNGINPDCSKCFGRGYYDTDTVNDSVLIKCFKPPVVGNNDNQFTFEDKIKTLSDKQLKILLDRLISKISFKTKQIKICKNKRLKDQYRNENELLVKNLLTLNLYIEAKRNNVKKAKV